MKPLGVICLAIFLALKCAPAEEHETAASVSRALGQMSPDPQRTFQVREIELVRGDVKIYLNEGVLSFLTPVSGATVAAIFSTQPVEAGDAEVIVLPPQRNERAALAAFTKTPNLDEHFDSALFLFTDQTAQELLAAIQEKPVHNAPAFAAQVTATVQSLVQDIGGDLRARLVAGLLDQHQAQQGFLFAAIGGRALGTFDVTYSPADLEQVTVGREMRRAQGPAFQLWTSFRSRRTGAFKPPPASVSQYRITSEIDNDLGLKSEAAFSWNSLTKTRVVPLNIAAKLRIDSAEIDQHPVEVMQSDLRESGFPEDSVGFYLVAESDLAPGEHQIKVAYHGSVIRKTAVGSYFVDDRNAWYPFTHPTLAAFDLTFRCPAGLKLVSTGELVSDEVHGGVRTVHRVTKVPEALAGFNLGDYQVSAEDDGPYHVEAYSDKTSGAEQPNILKQAAAILEYYTKRWMPLPIHSVAVSPIPATFGQGFPGLIYLSSMSYTREQDRPLTFRTAVYDQFFTDLLLPHEVAHQWWGNLVVASDYRSAWIMEALANYSALQFLREKHGAAGGDAILTSYRDDVTRQEGGKPVEAYGPLEFGIRLMDLGNAGIWHAILYEKGTWVMQMLHERLGDQGFLKMELALLNDYANRPITNEDLRQVASSLLQPGQPDKNLTSFFDTWVYGTGVPYIKIQGGEVTVSGVDENFTADVPLHCQSKGKPDIVRWFRVDSGTNSLDLPPGSACRLPAPTDFLYVPAP